jgi:hypothetical protein
MNWSDSSEIAAGLVLEGRLSINAVRPELFIEPYNRIIKLKQKNPEISIEELISTIGFSPIDSATRAVHNMNGMGDRNWVQILEQSALLYDAGAKMGKLAQRMQQGDTPDLTFVRSFLNDFDAGNTDTFQKFSDIQEEEVDFIPTGWEAFDKHIGGLPPIGMIILGGLPGVGKTTSLGRLIGSFLKTHDKNVALFSLEMMAQELKKRLKPLMKLSDEQQNRLYVSEKSLSVSEIIGEASRIDDLGLVVVDFIDLAIDGEIDVGSTTLAYTQFAKAAKSLRCPIIVIVQLNDLVGMPKPRNIRFSRLAWGLAWMVLMLYDPSVNWSNNSDDDKVLPVVEGQAYIICWKVRGGFRTHENESPGAILIPFNGKQGWHPTQGQWFSLRKVS